MTDHVTPAQLLDLLGSGADAARVDVAVEAANALVDRWVGTGPDAARPDPWPSPVSRQAGLEAAQTLYRRHAATGGFLDAGGLLAQLPPDVSRGIRDLLDADSHTWGIA